MAGLFLLPFSIAQDKSSEILKLCERSGISELNLSMKYHASRLLTFESGVRISHTADGSHYYPVNPDFYSTQTCPSKAPISAMSGEQISDLFTRAQSAGIKVGAWSVFLHDSSIGFRIPSTWVTNVFSDPLMQNLCPNNPDVRSYLISHTRELLDYQISHISFESIAFPSFRHNEHHERYFINLSPATEFLLSLCFCTHCRNSHLDNGVDVELLQTNIRTLITKAVESSDPWLNKELTPELLIDTFDEPMEKLIASRKLIISGLHDELSELVRKHGVQSRFLDGSPISNRDSDRPFEALWQSGIGVDALTKYFDFIEPLVYRSRNKEVGIVTESYVKAFGGEKIIAALRPFHPDISNLDEIGQRIHSLRDLVGDRIDIYLYDAIRPIEWERVRRALKSST